MSTAIYYFSGTGNSLFAAKILGEKIPGPVRILPIKSFHAIARVNVSEERIILVFPVYFQTIPDIVRSFLDKLEFGSDSPDIYGIATCNGGPGHSLYTMKRILAKHGLPLKAGFSVIMPGNSLILRDFTNSDEVRSQRLRECYPKMEEIFAYINGRQSGRMDGTDQARSHLQGMFFGMAAKRVYRTPSRFRTTDSCTRCGTCVRVCPSKNIIIGEKGVEWGQSCEHCLACFHWCPMKAVEIGQFTIGKLRYHHPDISICEMLDPSSMP